MNTTPEDVTPNDRLDKLKKLLPEDINATEINLRFKDLTTEELRLLIPELTKYRSLRYLNLSMNNLTALPVEILELTTLLDLDISYNKIKALPEDFYKLSKLEILTLNNNQFEIFPSQALELPLLKSFKMDDNPVYENLRLALSYRDRGPEATIASLRYDHLRFTTQEAFERQIALVPDGKNIIATLVEKVLLPQLVTEMKAAHYPVQDIEHALEDKTLIASLEKLAFEKFIKGRRPADIIPEYLTIDRIVTANERATLTAAGYSEDRISAFLYPQESTKLSPQQLTSMRNRLLIQRRVPEDTRWSPLLDMESKTLYGVTFTPIKRLSDFPEGTGMTFESLNDYRAGKRHAFLVTEPTNQGVKTMLLELKRANNGVVSYVWSDKYHGRSAAELSALGQEAIKDFMKAVNTYEEGYKRNPYLGDPEYTKDPYAHSRILAELDDSYLKKQAPTKEKIFGQYSKTEFEALLRTELPTIMKAIAPNTNTVATIKQLEQDFRRAAQKTLQDAASNSGALKTSGDPQKSELPQAKDLRGGNPTPPENWAPAPELGTVEHNGHTHQFEAIANAQELDAALEKLGIKPPEEEAAKANSKQRNYLVISDKQKELARTGQQHYYLQMDEDEVPLALVKIETKHHKKHGTTYRLSRHDVHISPKMGLVTHDDVTGFRDRCLAGLDKAVDQYYAQLENLKLNEKENPVALEKKPVDIAAEDRRVEKYTPITTPTTETPGIRAEVQVLERILFTQRTHHGTRDLDLSASEISTLLSKHKIPHEGLSFPLTTTELDWLFSAEQQPGMRRFKKLETINLSGHGLTPAQLSGYFSRLPTLQSITMDGKTITEQQVQWQQAQHVGSAASASSTYPPNIHKTERHHGEAFIALLEKKPQWVEQLGSEGASAMRRYADVLVDKTITEQSRAASLQSLRLTIIDAFAKKVDPTGATKDSNKSYPFVEWVCRQAVAEAATYGTTDSSDSSQTEFLTETENLTTIQSKLRAFDQSKASLQAVQGIEGVGKRKPSEIEYYQHYAHFQQALSAHQQRIELKAKRATEKFALTLEQKAEIERGTVVLADDPKLGKAILVTNAEAAKFYTNGTKLCLSASPETEPKEYVRQFNYHNPNYPIIILLMNEDGTDLNGAPVAKGDSQKYKLIGFEAGEVRNVENASRRYFTAAEGALVAKIKQNHPSMPKSWIPELPTAATPQEADAYRQRLAIRRSYQDKMPGLKPEEFLPEHLADTQLIASLIRRTPRSYYHLPEAQQRDPEYIKCVVARDANALGHVQQTLNIDISSNRELLLSANPNNPAVWEFVGQDLRNDPSFCKELLAKNPNVIHHLLAQTNTENEAAFVQDALKLNGLALAHLIDTPYARDHALVLSALEDYRAAFKPSFFETVIDKDIRENSEFKAEFLKRCPFHPQNINKPEAIPHQLALIQTDPEKAKPYLRLVPFLQQNLAAMMGDVEAAKAAYQAEMTRLNLAPLSVKTPQPNGEKTHAQVVERNSGSTRHSFTESELHDLDNARITAALWQGLVSLAVDSTFGLYIQPKQGGSLVDLFSSDASLTESAGNAASIEGAAEPDLGAAKASLKERLKSHNPASPYSEAYLRAYVEQNLDLEYREGEIPPARTMVDWNNQPKLALARLISHLPAYYQRMLIEGGANFFISPTKQLFHDSYYQRTGKTDYEGLEGVYISETKTIGTFRSAGTDQMTGIVFHEWGHFLDHMSANKNPLLTPQWLNQGMEGWSSKTLTAYLNGSQKTEGQKTLSANSWVGPKTIYDHLLNYPNSAEHPYEAFAEMFKHRMALDLLYPNNPEKVDKLIGDAYPKLYALFKNEALPTIKQRANEFTQFRKDYIEHAINLKEAASKKVLSEDARETLSNQYHAMTIDAVRIQAFDAAHAVATAKIQSFELHETDRDLLITKMAHVLLKKPHQVREYQAVAEDVVEDYHATRKSLEAVVLANAKKLGLEEQAVATELKGLSGQELVEYCTQQLFRNPKAKLLFSPDFSVPMAQVLAPFVEKTTKVDAKAPLADGATNPAVGAGSGNGTTRNQLAVVPETEKAIVVYTPDKKTATTPNIIGADVGIVVQPNGKTTSLPVIVSAGNGAGGSGGAHTSFSNTHWERHYIRAMKVNAGGGATSVTLGVLALSGKLNRETGTFAPDITSGDGTRKTAAITSVVADAAGIFSGFSEMAALYQSAKTFEQGLKTADGAKAAFLNAQHLKWATYAQRAGIVGLGVSVIAGTAEGVAGYREGNAPRVTNAGGGTVGGILGGLIAGGIAGSVVPVFGTAAGAAIGLGSGIIGAVFGSAAGSEAAADLFGKNLEHVFDEKTKDALNTVKKTYLCMHAQQLHMSCYVKTANALVEAMQGTDQEAQKKTWQEYQAAVASLTRIQAKNSPYTITDVEMESVQDQATRLQDAYTVQCRAFEKLWRDAQAPFYQTWEKENPKVTFYEAYAKAVADSKAYPQVYPMPVLSDQTANFRMLEKAEKIQQLQSGMQQLDYLYAFEKDAREGCIFDKSGTPHHLKEILSSPAALLAKQTNYFGVLNSLSAEKKQPLVFTPDYLRSRYHALGVTLHDPKTSPEARQQAQEEILQMQNGIADQTHQIEGYKRRFQKFQKPQDSEPSKEFSQKSEAELARIISHLEEVTIYLEEANKGFGKLMYHQQIIDLVERAQKKNLLSEKGENVVSDAFMQYVKTLAKSYMRSLDEGDESPNMISDKELPNLLTTLNKEYPNLVLEAEASQFTLTIKNNEKTTKIIPKR